ncbi:MAG: hypothetical protein FD187_16 [bacterium]|nr:MAG: hypothetical protein FD142_1233 [bacterium]KAF0150584.1 MAG: hypothetical protein FD187_16 [bacterium]KAF0169437.1 MAG: hypothetical protein FD158_270 [bacterium]TXT19767.1 MAG: hypothetical protein FD132_1599 [bacterium]
MKAHRLITLLVFASFFLSPAWAEHEGHQHGQSEAAAPAAAKQADGKGVDDMKSGGKSCKKCKQGKSGGGGGHDHGSGGHDHGAAGSGTDAAGDIDALRQHVRQLEKRLDLMQTLLETLAGQGRQGARGGGHAGHH